MPDATTRIGRSLVHHGPLNDRVYLLKLDEHDMPGLPRMLTMMARREGRGKVVAKVPERHRQAFADEGYVTEATVASMMDGEDGHFMSLFIDMMRKAPLSEKEAQIIRKSQASRKAPRQAHEVVELEPKDAREMARLMEEVFPSYPFPMSNPDYILHCMSDDVCYYGIKKKGKLVAMGAAEMDSANSCVEMTDLATRSSHRGMGMSSSLLMHMEERMAERGYRVSYTIARSASMGINMVFGRAGHRYGGTLSLNTNISGRMEHMNVWHKRL